MEIKLNLKATRKNTEYIKAHYSRIMASKITLMDVRQSAISAIAMYQPFMADLHQAIKEADQYAYSRREGSAVQAKAVAHAAGLEECRQELLTARKALLAQFNICGSCFGKGNEAGWTCPNCGGGGKERAEEVPTTEPQIFDNTPAPEAVEATSRALRHNRFTRGTGAYKCADCGKLTRDTGNGEAMLDMPLCLACYEAAGLYNEHVDGHHDESPNPDCPLCKAEAERPTTEREGKEMSIDAVRCPKCADYVDDQGVCHTCQTQTVVPTEPGTDGRYWADEGRVDAPATRPEISVAWQGSGIKISGPAAVYQCVPTNVPSGDQEYAYNGWAVEWLGILPVGGQSYRVCMMETGEVLGTFSTDLEVAEFIYTTLQQGLTATLYARQATEPEAPAVVPAEPPRDESLVGELFRRFDTMQASADDLTAMGTSTLQVLGTIGENTLGRLAVLEAKLDGLISMIIPLVEAHKATQAAKPTTQQATALAAVEATVEAAQADPTMPCPNTECIKGMIALGQKCPVCSGTGRVLKQARCITCGTHLKCADCHECIVMPIPVQCPHCKNALGTGVLACDECFSTQILECEKCTKYFVPTDDEYVWCPECRAAQQAEPSTDPDDLDESPEENEEAPEEMTPARFLALMDDPVNGPTAVEWAVWVLGNRQTEEELSAGGTLYENGRGFNGADSGYGTSLYNWLANNRHSQPHLTAKQLEAARKMVKKYAATQLMHALADQEWGGPHIASSFKVGDYVKVTTWENPNEHVYRVTGHSWLYLWVVNVKTGKAGVTRWFDCLKVDGPQEAVADEAGLEDMEL